MITFKQLLIGVLIGVLIGGLGVVAWAYWPSQAQWATAAPYRFGDLVVTAYDDDRKGKIVNYGTKWVDRLYIEVAHVVCAKGHAPKTPDDKACHIISDVMEFAQVNLAPGQTQTYEVQGSQTYVSDDHEVISGAPEPSWDGISATELWRFSLQPFERKADGTPTPRT